MEAADSTVFRTKFAIIMSTTEYLQHIRLHLEQWVITLDFTHSLPVSCKFRLQQLSLDLTALAACSFQILPWW